MKNVVIAGAGFAGLAAAAGAARKLDELGATNDVRLIVVDQNDYHSIRVRNYEDDLAPSLVPLSKVLEPIGVEHVRAKVVDIDTGSCEVRLHTEQGPQALSYDKFVYALGSHVVRPNLPGADYLHDIDTYPAAECMNLHLRRLSALESFDGQFTVVVVGAGLTGIELACELPARLLQLAGASRAQSVRVVLVDANSQAAESMGNEAQAVIAQALSDLRIEVRCGQLVRAVSKEGVEFEGGEFIPAATVVWCAGMRAPSLGGRISSSLDAVGRVSVDHFMRVTGTPNVFAAGDTARFEICPGHDNVMSCQHGRPMGRYAGHNVVAELFDVPMLPLLVERYVNVVDLGAWGAVYTQGWNREVIAVRNDAKRTKQIINRQRIYPPLSGVRADILADAAPVLQSAPTVQIGSSGSG
ncbi:MAG: proton-conducting membrane transporter [Pusillimonas sp.]|nr:proton-conducting membrane transporter [Pusillimonas sp.]|tara:strand:+ start:39542 stop:40777 length:1236 start_codon:yes stop_codon:yes gene_type:complete